MVVFGDSLSDSGNAFALRGAASTPPDYALDPLLIPGAPYARGRTSFPERRNLGRAAGPVAADRRQRRPGVSIARGVASNFAVGGARAREDGNNLNLPTQVASYLERTGGIASPSALYVIAIGSSDVRDALARLFTRTGRRRHHGGCARSHQRKPSRRCRRQAPEPSSCGTCRTSDSHQPCGWPGPRRRNSLRS